jgi:hypothetical protein
MAFDVNKIFRDNQQLFQIAYQEKNYLFTHAGVTKMWYNRYLKSDIPIVKQLNEMWGTTNIFLFAVGVERGGSSKYGGPLWVGIDELKNPYSIMEDIDQIVGHNKVKKVTKYENKTGTGSFTIIDCLDKQDLTYILEIE